MVRNNRRPRSLDYDRPSTTRTSVSRRAQAALVAAYDAEWAAAKTGQPYQHFWRFHPSAYDTVRQALALQAGQLVLEFGAGNGTTTLRLASDDVQVIAVELSSTGLHVLQQRAAAADLTQKIAPLRADAQALPLANASVDRVYGENFLMYVSPATIGQETARVLRPDGHAVFLEPTAHHPLIKLYRRFGSPYRHTAPHYFSLDHLNALGAHFGKLTHQEYYLTAILALPCSAHPFLFALTFRLFAQLDRRLMQLLPSLRRYCWLTVITLSQPKHSPGHK